MLVIKELWNLWRTGNLAAAIRTYKIARARRKEGNEIAAKMESLGLQPDTRIGTAIRAANCYGIEFDIGTTHYDCRAILPRSKWRKLIDRTVPLETLAFFMIPKSYDEIEDFQGISDRIEIAICKCLIQARIAGVI